MKGDEVRVHKKEFLTPSNLYLGNKEIIKKQRKERLGSEFTNNKNIIGKCIEYINSANITVLLENGEICHTRWSNFSTGRFGTQRMNERLGEKNYNNQGLLMEIVKYNGKRDIDVKFKDGFISKNRRYDEFKNGQIKDLMYPSVFNVGYIGGEKYKVSKNGKVTLEYNKWYGMLSRCYAENELSRFPTYIPCTVCNEWLNFQNFAGWLHEKYYEIPNEIMCLDKDILFKRNKIYSPKTCCIVPDNINILFTKTDALRGKYPIGVSWHKEHNCFVSQMNRDGKLIHLVNFNNPIDAFNMYKKEKEKEIKRQANIYKKYLPQNVYDALLKYEVEIDD